MDVVCKVKKTKFNEKQKQTNNARSFDISNYQKVNKVARRLIGYGSWKDMFKSLHQGKIVDFVVVQYLH